MIDKIFEVIIFSVHGDELFSSYTVKVIKKTFQKCFYSNKYVAKMNQVFNFGNDRGSHARVHKWI